MIKSPKKKTLRGTSGGRPERNAEKRSDAMLIEREPRSSVVCCWVYPECSCRLEPLFGTAGPPQDVDAPPLDYGAADYNPAFGVDARLKRNQSVVSDEVPLCTDLRDRSSLSQSFVCVEHFRPDTSQTDATRGVSRLGRSLPAEETLLRACPPSGPPRTPTAEWQPSFFDAVPARDAALAMLLLNARKVSKPQPTLDSVASAEFRRRYYDDIPRGRSSKFVIRLGGSESFWVRPLGNYKGSCVIFPHAGHLYAATREGFRYVYETRIPPGAICLDLVGRQSLQSHRLQGLGSTRYAIAASLLFIDFELVRSPGCAGGSEFYVRACRLSYSPNDQRRYNLYAAKPFVHLVESPSGDFTSADVVNFFRCHPKWFVGAAGGLALQYLSASELSSVHLPRMAFSHDTATRLSVIALRFGITYVTYPVGGATKAVCVVNGVYVVALHGDIPVPPGVPTLYVSGTLKDSAALKHAVTAPNPSGHIRAFCTHPIIDLPPGKHLYASLDDVVLGGVLTGFVIDDTLYVSRNPKDGRISADMLRERVMVSHYPGAPWPLDYTPYVDRRGADAPNVVADSQYKAYYDVDKEVFVAGELRFSERSSRRLLHVGIAGAGKTYAIAKELADTPISLVVPRKARLTCSHKKIVDPVQQRVFQYNGETIKFRGLGLRILDVVPEDQLSGRQFTEPILVDDVQRLDAEYFKDLVTRCHGGLYLTYGLDQPNNATIDAVTELLAEFELSTFGDLGLYAMQACAVSQARSLHQLFSPEQWTWFYLCSSLNSGVLSVKVGLYAEVLKLFSSLRCALSPVALLSTRTSPLPKSVVGMLAAGFRKTGSSIMASTSMNATDCSLQLKADGGMQLLRELG